MRHAAPIASLLLLVVSSAAADTIVLKNGRRIVAASVTEDGDRVRYETPAGTMSIPKSIVARIDRDGLGYSSGSSASSEPPVSAACGPGARLRRHRAPGNPRQCH